MIIAMSPWAVAVLIEAILLASVAAVYFSLQVKKTHESYADKIAELEARVADALEEARRIEEEAMKKRTIVTFDVADLEALVEKGEMAGDAEKLEVLEGRILETSEVVDGMSVSAGDLSSKLSEVMEKQMEAVNMVGRLGGTGGLSPEIKEKAEEILDVFRMMDEILSGAYEGVDRLESGLQEVSSVITDYREASPKVKLPTAELLNATLKQKVGLAADAPLPPNGETTVETEGPPLDAFDETPAEEEARV